MDKKEQQGQKKNSLVLPFPFLILKDYKCLSKHNATHVAHCSSVYSDLTLHESVPAVFSVPHDSSLRPLTPRTPVFSSPHSLPKARKGLRVEVKGSTQKGARVSRDRGQTEA
jgi:hypothetical protein